MVFFTHSIKYMNCLRSHLLLVFKDMNEVDDNQYSSLLTPDVAFYFYRKMFQKKYRYNHDKGRASTIELNGI